MMADDRLIVALDVESVDEAWRMVDELGDAVSFYKIGMELVAAGGIELAKGLREVGKKVFLDLKLHDIGTTVERATRSASKLGVNFLTVHGYPQTMKAAVQGREGDLRILAVTVLTSYDDAELISAGYQHGVRETVTMRACSADLIGVDGIVASPLEVDLVRRALCRPMSIVTPGVRLTGGETNDQKRVATPQWALASGATHIVVGRPITSSDNPRLVAEVIVDSIQALPQVR